MQKSTLQVAHSFEGAEDGNNSAWVAFPHLSSDSMQVSTVLLRRMLAPFSCCRVTS